MKGFVSCFALSAGQNEATLRAMPGRLPLPRAGNPSNTVSSLHFRWMELASPTLDMALVLT